MGGMCVKGDDTDTMGDMQQTSITTKQKIIDGQNVELKKKNTVNFEQYKSFKKVKDIKEHYKFGQELGHGAFGSVYKTSNKQTGVDAAIKVISK